MLCATGRRGAHSGGRVGVHVHVPRADAQQVRGGPRAQAGRRPFGAAGAERGARAPAGGESVARARRPTLRLLRAPPLRRTGASLLHICSPQSARYAAAVPVCPLTCNSASAPLTCAGGERACEGHHGAVLTPIKRLLSQRASWRAKYRASGRLHLNISSNMTNRTI